MLNDDTLLVVLILLTMLVIVSAMGGGIRYREDFDVDDEDMSSVGLLLQHGYVPPPVTWDETPPAAPSMPAVAAPVHAPPAPAQPAEPEAVTGLVPDALQAAGEFEASVPPAKPQAVPEARVDGGADAPVPDAYFGSEYYPVE